MFCDISPTCYKIALQKEICKRHIKNFLAHENYADTQDTAPLPCIVAQYSSHLIKRGKGIDPVLQENKAVNIRLANEKLNGILIRPGETFSFWHLVGNATARRGFKEGLTISGGETKSGVGGGMCQMTNLIHWMILHTPLTIVEHHHHDGLDLFPDFNRQIPFGTGTSICYNYLDYRFRNDTEATYQLLVHVDGEYLRGELRSDRRQKLKYHIKSEHEGFVREDGVVYRVGEIWRDAIDPVTGNLVERTLIRTNHARVMYDTARLDIRDAAPQN